jgi:hypothetical protein
VYAGDVIPVSNEQRHFLRLDGAPLPLVDEGADQCYMLMPVTFSRTPDGSVQAPVPGICAVGEADQPLDALATLAVLLQDKMEYL